MKKIIAKLEEHPELKAIDIEITETAKEFHRRGEWIDNARKNLDRDVRDMQKSINTRIIAYVEKHKLAPKEELDLPHAHVHLEGDLGLLVLCDEHKRSGLADLLGQLGY